MFKSKLQELCQGKGWLLPEYQTSKGGFDHEPRFLAQVNVHGQKFSSPGDAKSSKQAQNEAARTALNHLLSPPNQCLTAASVPPLPSLALTMKAPNLPTNNEAHVEIASPKKLISKSEKETAANSQNPCKIGEDFPVKESKPVAFKSKNKTGKLIVPDPFLTTHFQGFVTNTIPYKTPKPDQSNMEAERTAKRRIEEIIEQPNTQSNEMPNIPSEKSIINNETPISKVSATWKNRLQEHCQRNKIALPVYTCDRLGPDHSSLFNCKVTVDGQTYASETHFPNVKEAESDAARVALKSIPSNKVKIEENNYKNVLQELSQKSGCGFPGYTHCSTGDPHNLTFVSTVSIGHQSFTGEGFKTKKAADMSAAKTAYKALTEKMDEIKVTKQPKESKTCFSDVVSYVQNSFQPKVGGSSSGQEDWEMNSQIKVLLEKNPLCRKGVVVYPKELGVSFPSGHVESIADDKWIITNFKP